MGKKSSARLIGCLAAASLVALAPIAPAAAAAPDRFTFDDHGEFDFPVCGVASHVVSDESGRGTIRWIGGQAYALVNWDGHVSITRESTGKSVTLDASFIDRDAKITDNGDGTITLEGHSIINETDYGPDGEVGLRTAGLQKFVTVLDLNGTPGNLDDDEELSWDLLTFSGRDDRQTTDFCDWYLGVTQ